MSISLLLVAAVGSLVALAPGSAATTRPRGVSCSSCVVVDDEGTVLWSRAAGERRPNASTTKMVTALVVDATTDLEERVRVSGAAASVGGGGHDLRRGDRYTVRDLLHAMLLSSSNEAAAALAEHVSGTQEAFAAEMNRTAKRVGARDSHFVNPHGLDAPGHHSTATDLARIALDLLEHPLLRRIVGTLEAPIQTPEGRVVVENGNPLLEAYPGAIGVKTGQTLGAGNVLVAAAERRGRVVVAVAMASQDAAADSRKMLDFGFRAVGGDRRADVAKRELANLRAGAIGSVLFDLAGATDVVVDDDLAAAAASLSGPLEVSFAPASDIRLPVGAGETIGDLKIASARGTVVVDAIASNAVDPPRSSWLIDLIAALLRAAAWLAGGPTG